MSEFLKLAYELISKIIYNFVQCIVALFHFLFTSWADYAVIFVGMAVLLLVEYKQEQGMKVRETLAKQRPAVQYLALLIPLLVIFFLGVFRTGYISSEFIYKQF